MVGKRFYSNRFQNVWNPGLRIGSSRHGDDRQLFGVESQLDENEKITFLLGLKGPAASVAVDGRAPIQAWVFPRPKRCKSNSNHIPWRFPPASPFIFLTATSIQKLATLFPSSRVGLHRTRKTFWVLGKRVGFAVYFFIKLILCFLEISLYNVSHFPFSGVAMHLTLAKSHLLFFGGWKLTLSLKNVSRWILPQGPLTPASNSHQSIPILQLAR